MNYPFNIRGKLAFTTDEVEAGRLGFSVSGGATIMEHTLVTEDCLDRSDEECHPDCESNNGVCECLWEKSSGDFGGGGFWEYGADKGTVLLDEATQSYCVDGDMLSLTSGSAETPYLMVYRRAD
jgi:hypothetical protein